MDAEFRTGPGLYSDGTKGVIPRTGRQGEVIVADYLGRYAEASRRGNLFMANAIVTSPVIFSTAAGTGGPIIWNGSTTTNVSIVAVSYAVTTASGAVGALGFTGNSGQTSAPGSTTAIDSRANLYIGGAASGATPYKVGTPTNAGAFFMPFAQITTATTAVPIGNPWIEIGGAITIPPNCWVSVAGSATLTSLVAQIGILFQEFPV
jgi:hypothetical protein